MKIFSIIQKNLKVLIRSKVSALIVVLGPLFIVLLVGMAFNTSSLTNIKIGTYSANYSELSNDILTSLEDKQFVIIKSLNEQDCRSNVVTGGLHVCMIIPPDLKIEPNKTNEIIFYVDNSRINLVYLILDQISDKLEIKTTQLSKELTQVLIDTLNNAKSELTSSKEGISSISSNIDTISSKADSIVTKSSDIEIKFDKADYNITTIKAQVSASCANCSTALSSLDTLQSNLDTLTKKVESLNSTSKALISDSQSIKEKVNANKADISAVSTSVSGIITNIEGIQVKEAGSIVQPITTKIEPVTEKTTSWNFLFPTLVALIIMFVAILLSSTLVVREKKTSAYFRNFITPTTDFTFLIGTYLTCLFILVIQLLIIFGQSFYYLKGELLNVLVGTSLFLFIAATTFIFLGMMIGYLFESEETSILAAMSVAAFLLFFSNTILPIETIPANLSWIAFFNPFVIMETILKKLILFKVPLSAISYEIYMIIAYAILFLVLAFLARELTKRKYT